MRYVRTFHGKRVHLAEENAAHTLCWDEAFPGSVQKLVEVDGPSYPETLCDHCQRVQKRERYS